MNIHRKRKLVLRKNEIDRLENEVVISKIVFGVVHGRPYEGFQNTPIY